MWNLKNNTNELIKQKQTPRYRKQIEEDGERSIRSMGSTDNVTVYKIDKKDLRYSTGNFIQPRNNLYWKCYIYYTLSYM